MPNLDYPLPEQPVMLQVEITTECNLACRMCPITTLGTPSTLSPGSLKPMVWAQIRELAKQVGKVNLTGYGEPFLHPRFLDMLRELDDIGVQTSFSTNGIPVRSPAVRKLSELEHLVHVNVSIDSPDADLYRAIRGGEVRRALAGLKLLVDGLPGPLPMITVSSLLMEDSLDSLTQFPEILAGIGVKTWHVQCMSDWNIDLKLQHLVYQRGAADRVRVLQAAAEAHGITCVLENAERLAMELNDPDAAVTAYHDENIFSGGISKRCSVPWNIPFINKNGQVFPCCNGDHSAILGDLRSQSFDEIWKGKQFSEFRENLLSGAAVPAICRKCTQAATGVHPFREYALRILHDKSCLSGEQSYRLVVQNIGEREWTAATRLRIATIEPRGRSSPLYHSSWLARDRVSSFRETVVAPGEEATFEFACSGKGDRHSKVKGEPFALIADGVDWLLNSRIEISPPRFATRVEIVPQRYAARILMRKSHLARGERCRLVVQNVGSEPWDHRSLLRIGTAQPHDRYSTLYHRDWIHTNRVATFREERVPPGAEASFDFRCVQGSPASDERFELVLETVAWLEQTLFEIGVSCDHAMPYHGALTLLPAGPI